jgi:DNA-binding NarL/FixJ family response regulator
MSDITVAIVEDHDVVRIGLRAILQSHPGIEVIGEATNGTQGLKLLQTSPPDIAIVDIGLPGMDGIEMTRQFRSFQAEHAEVTTKTIMLTMQGTEESVLAAFAAGADSYCMKDTSMDRLVEAVIVTHGGNPWIDPAIANIVLRQMRQGMPSTTSVGKRMIEIKAVESEYQEILATYPLTDRELEVLELMVSGCTNVEIAEKLFITAGTVKTHVRNILGKLCADDRTEAAVRALRSGLIG